MGNFLAIEGDGKDLFKVSEDGDSIMVYTVIVGDQNKHSTWAYKEAFISSFPEKPLLQLFQKIERESPLY